MTEVPRRVEDGQTFEGQVPNGAAELGIQCMGARRNEGVRDGKVREGAISTHTEPSPFIPVTPFVPTFWRNGKAK
ncbi:MAG: hypothetical protein WAL22_10055 [Solirubrobacteraceae bacterium]